MSDYWDRYWQEGFITSFGSSFKGNYTGVYEKFWYERFSLISENTKVLDLATGNAAIPILLLEYQKLNPLNLSIVGTDKAKSLDISVIKGIVKKDELDWSNLSLMGGIDSADLPFEDESFDYIYSQYGFEYSDQSRTIDELLRLANPACQITFLIHSSDSIIIQKNRKELAVLEFLLEPNSLLHIFEVFLKSIGTIGSREQLAELKNDQIAEKHRNNLNTQMQLAFDEFGDILGDVGFSDLVSELMSEHVFSSLSTKCQMIHVFRSQCVAHISRLKDLMNSAYEFVDLEPLKQKFSDASFIVDVNEVINEDGKLGLSFIASRG